AIGGQDGHACTALTSPLWAASLQLGSSTKHRVVCSSRSTSHGQPMQPCRDVPGRPRCAHRAADEEGAGILRRQVHHRKHAEFAEREESQLLASLIMMVLLDAR